MTKAIITAGSVSHGTLRTVDLLQAFASELERIAGASEMTREAFKRANALTGDADETDRDSELVNELLPDALDAAAPAGLYFGTHEGDGSDFGFWPTEDGRRAALSQEFSAAFVTDTRDNGESFLKLADNAPEWMTNAIYAAHGNGSLLPNDWSYRLARHVVDGIAERLANDCECDLDDERHEIVDAGVPVYNAERLAWLASSISRADYCDTAREEGLVAEDASMSDRIAAGMYKELDVIYSAIVDALNSEAE